VFKVETIGDAYMIACGHDCSTRDHALRMAAAAVDMLAATEEISEQIGSTVQIRIGMHTGKPSCRWCTARVLLGLYGRNSAWISTGVQRLHAVCWCVQMLWLQNAAAAVTGHQTSNHVGPGAKED
jgi:hypothetical protein